MDDKTLLLSPRNGIEGHAKCHTLFSAPGTKVSAILTKGPMRHIIIVSLEQLLSGGSVGGGSHDKASKEGAIDSFIIIHTSGSTGLPKPITIGHVT